MSLSPFLLKGNRILMSGLQAVVLCGPSGVGKGTLVKCLLNNFPQRFAFSVSHTTRAPRKNEVAGVDYHFVDVDTIMAMKGEGKFLELCKVHNNWYGTSFAAVKEVENQGKVCIVEIDVQGAVELRSRATDLNVVYIFLSAPLDALHQRIAGRGGSTPEDIETRLATARKEFDFVKQNVHFFDMILENDVFDDTYEAFKTYINKMLIERGMKPLL